MKFHPQSFVLGLGGAVALLGARRRLRPVVVELTALTLHFGRLGLALIERQREHAEDLWAEAADSARRRAERRPRSPGPPAREPPAEEVSR